VRGRIASREIGFYLGEASAAHSRSPQDLSDEAFSDHIRRPGEEL
jgi:hypothetical protein